MEEKVKGPASGCCLLMHRLNHLHSCQDIRLSVYPRLLCGPLFDFFFPSLCSSCSLFAVSLMWSVCLSCGGVVRIAREICFTNSRKDQSENWAQQCCTGPRLLSNDFNILRTEVVRRFRLKRSKTWVSLPFVCLRPGCVECVRPLRLDKTEPGWSRMLNHVWVRQEEAEEHEGALWFSYDFLQHGARPREQLQVVGGR